MSRSLNKVMLIGNLGAEPDMKYTPNGKAVTNLRIAINRTQNGAETTEWFSVILWEKVAETANQYLHKGSKVYIEGRLQTRSWEDKNGGGTQYRTEVIGSEMIMLDQRNGNGRTAGPAIGDQEDAEALPF